MKSIIQTGILVLLGFLLMSCTAPSDNSLPDNLKIKDLAPRRPDGSPEMNRLKTMNLDIQVLEIPAENFSKLGEIRRTLSISPIRFNNRLAFSDNSFSAYYGRNQTLGTVYDLLQLAGAQNVITSMVIMLNDGQSEDVMIKPLPGVQPVSYYSLDGSPESARVGPGNLSMHITVQKKSDTLDTAGTVTIFPMFTIATANTIPELTKQEKLREFPFTSAALQLNMTPGDFIVLAPETYISDQSTLCGLFFANPYGSMFMHFNENKPPERKPSIRIYIITCIGLNL